MGSWTRRLGYGSGTVVVLVAAFAGFVYASSASKASRTYDIATTEVPVSLDSATIARGKHLTFAIAMCVECHSEDLGGRTMLDDPLLGVVIAANITTGQGGVLAAYGDAELARVIRHGVKRDGRSVIIMPSEDYQFMSDADVGAIISYLRSQPAVDRTPGTTVLRPIGRALVATNQLPLYAAEKVDHTRRPPATIDPDTSVAYGEYVANAGGCTGCHGPGLSGGPIPGMPPDAPPAANLTPSGIGRYSDVELETILRTGIRPDGSTVRPDMPWRYTAMMTPVEMAATLRYLRTVPAKAFGGR